MQKKLLLFHFFVYVERPLPAKSEIASGDTATERKHEEIRKKSESDAGKKDLAAGWTQSYGKEDEFLA